MNSATRMPKAAAQCCQNFMSKDAIGLCLENLLQWIMDCVIATKSASKLQVSQG
jgi:hypothetical protein